MDFAISGTLMYVLRYSSRVDRSKVKAGARGTLTGLTFWSCADYCCRKRKQRRLGRTKDWNMSEGNYGT